MANKFSNEQLLALKKAGFSAEEISLFEFNPAYAPTNEEFEAIFATNEIAQSLSFLPENQSAFFKQINDTYGVLFDQNLSEDELKQQVQILAKQNPTLAKQVASLFLLIDYASNEE